MSSATRALTVAKRSETSQQVAIKSPASRLSCMGCAFLLGPGHVIASVDMARLDDHARWQAVQQRKPGPAGILNRHIAALIALTRMFWCPKSLAKYMTLASSAALATHITL